MLRNFLWPQFEALGMIIAEILFNLKNTFHNDLNQKYIVLKYRKYKLYTFHLCNKFLCILKTKANEENFWGHSRISLGPHVMLGSK